MGELGQSRVCEHPCLLSWHLQLCDSGGRTGSYSLRFGFLGAHIKMGWSNPLQKASTWAALLLLHGLTSLPETLGIERSFQTRCLFVFQLKNQQQRKIGMSPTLTRLAGGGAYLVLCGEVLDSFRACMQFPKEQDFL